MTVRIALDAMGGDRGPTEIIPAAIHVLRENPQLELILVGREADLKPLLARYSGAETARVEVRDAPEVVEMHEPPSVALRVKKSSSMRIAIDLVKDGTAQACVSSGNTGALMAMARYVLKMLPGVDRPAICTTMPGINGQTHILDLGANVVSDSDQLFQFAVMGSVRGSVGLVLGPLPNPGSS